MSVRVGVLLMDDLPATAVHVQGDYPDLFRHLFRDEDVELVLLAVHRGEVPASLADCDAWVVGGSRFSVYDDLDWIATAEDVVRAAVDVEHPLVGICFGHQLIAQALGGRVERAAVGWGVGARTYDTVHPLPFFPEGTASSTLLACHQDQVVALPDDASVWSSADYCPIAGMTIGERAWSMQGHPEFTAPVCDALYEGRRELLGADVVESARRSLATPLSNGAVAAAIVRLATG